MADWTRTPLDPVAAIVTPAAWFADFEACVGIDAACNAIDLVDAVSKLARDVGDDASLRRPIGELNEQPRVMFSGIVAASPDALTRRA
jgi:hypothetical protein